MNTEAIETSDIWEDKGQYYGPPSIYRVDYLDSQKTLGRNILIARITLTDEDRHGFHFLNYPMLNALKDVFADLCIPGGLTCYWNGGIVTAVMKVDRNILRYLHEMSADYSEVIARILELDEDLVTGITGTHAAKILKLSRSEFSAKTRSGEIKSCGARFADGSNRIPEGTRTALYSPKEMFRLAKQMQISPSTALA